MIRINEKLFWSKVKITDDCWVWTGCFCRGGMRYGRFCIGSRTDGSRKHDRSHRVAWMLDNEREIPSGKFVLHRCDNPPCCRPEHLYLGSHQENATDKVNRGRHRNGSRSVFGENHPNRILFKEQALEIRKNTKHLTQRDLSIEFGISQTQVSRIRTGKRWRRFE